MTTQAEFDGLGALRDHLVAAVVATLAPEEMPLVKTLHGLEDEAALRILTGRPKRRERLGFGLEAVIVMLTPVVWIAVDESVRRVIDASLERAGKARRVRRGIFGRRREALPAKVPELTREQLKLIEQSILDAARQARLSQARGERIADGVVRRLATICPSSEKPEQPPTSGQPGENSGDGE